MVSLRRANIIRLVQAFNFPLLIDS